MGMRVLCVYPLFPKSYWGAEHTRKFTGKRSLLPPLGLLTVAALLPPEVEVRLRDLNVRPLEAADLDWADVVFLSGMIIQRESMIEVARAARRAGKVVVAGGPYATLSPDVLQPLVDCVVIGEAEELIAPLVTALTGEAPLPPRLVAERRPELASSPVPRFDLLEVDAYQSLSLQSSRGCPFNCEFCDIIEMFGRKPRFKTPEQLLRECDAILATGFRGAVFLVDDNFIGNRVKVRRLLEALEEWMPAHRHPFDLYTQASVNLAADEPLIDAMVRAGFSSVFLGIETSSTKALRAAQKLQNTAVDIDAAVATIISRGLDVMAGFIIGFDTDDALALEQQRQWIAGSPIPMAMIGLLMALPGTQLERRLAREGRLRGDCSGNNFIRPNFVTRLDEAELLSGYARLLEETYAPGGYFERASRALELCKRDRSRHRLPPVYAIRCLLRSLFYQGFAGEYRGEYWRFLWRTLRRCPGRFSHAIRIAIHGEHMIRYTKEEVVPRLRRDLEAIPSGPARVAEALASPRAATARVAEALAAPRTATAPRAASA